MKTIRSIITLSVFAFFFFSCKDQRRGESRFLDLTTGEAVELEEDEETGKMVNAETGEPVEIYVDTKKRDTIYGPTGKVINGRVMRDEEGNYSYLDADMRRDEDRVNQENDDKEHAAKSMASGAAGAGYKPGEYKVKRGDYKYKREVEKDGDVTIKDGKKKIKIDGETGKKRVKYDD